ncbi:response regulator [Rhodocytophaga aerolata]|uniref:Response regulator n=1 Tax=Rhodocytophaga aerolata TaxID=455078 RepID=A0ABT8RG64_9BACT|nr:response regulator [Rhodocytophaga aerolata]MDO1451100.1 response regulator [Rhodocytophaga aerolata]
MKQLDKILIVDDDQTSTYLVKSLLEDLQVASHIATATNGKEALDYIDAHCKGAAKAHQQASANFCPELILLDINMPVMNGFEFLEECKQRHCFKDHQVKVVMLSSSAAQIDIQQAKVYQVSEYIVKPLTEEKIIELIG